MAGTNQPRSYQLWNTISATPGSFNLDAGRYGLLLGAGVWGTAILEKKVLTTAASWLPVSASIAANGYVVIDLPAGEYRLTLAGITGLYGEIAKISTGRA